MIKSSGRLFAGYLIIGLFVVGFSFGKIEQPKRSAVVRELTLVGFMGATLLWPVIAGRLVEHWVSKSPSECDDD